MWGFSFMNKFERWKYETRVFFLWYFTKGFAIGWRRDLWDFADKVWKNTLRRINKL